MSLYDEIVSVYPELESKDFDYKGSIELRDDGDGVPYIYRWEYDQPIPDGLKLGK